MNNTPLSNKTNTSSSKYKMSPRGVVGIFLIFLGLVETLCSYSHYFFGFVGLALVIIGSLFVVIDYLSFGIQHTNSPNTASKDN